MPPRPPVTEAVRRRWRRLWGLLGLLAAVPVSLTLAGALTSPPHAKSVPVGHLIYMEADEPSDHTSILRGLRIMGPDGVSRELLHETEPQDRDAGSRDWISQPQASPDGRWLAYEKQDITLQEEEQSIVNQLWVMPLDGSNPQPRLLLDLTRQHLKQFVGLAWTPDSRHIIFHNADGQYQVSRADGSLARPPATVKAAVLTQTYTAGSDAGAIALSPDGTREATATAGSPTVVLRWLRGLEDVRRIKAFWGWSVFGKRHITALKWSPDGKYLAYSVSKPPFEDELFYIDLATGKCFQLPVRTGTGGWDWAP